MSDSRQPTDRDQFWLDHEASLARSGQTAKAYAAEQGLSLHALYQARKRLRTLGFMAPAARCRRKPPGGEPRTVAFSKVGLASTCSARPDFRLLLPNGLVLEWSGTELAGPIVELVERLTRQP